MRSQIHALGDSEFVHMAVVAQGGWGKTCFAGTAPNALFITTDPEGAQSAFRQGSKADEVKVYDQAGLTNIQLDLLEGLEHEYEFLLIDDMTTIMQIFARTSIDNRVRRTSAKANKSADQEALDAEMRKIVAIIEGDGNLNRYVPELNDRYTYQNATIDFVKWCTQLKMNVIWLYKRQSSSYTIDEDGSDAYWTAAIEGRGGAVAEECLGFANIFASCETTSDGKRRMWFEHHKKHRGKDRTDRLKPFRDDLTVPRMMSLISAPAAESDGEEVASKPARPRPRKRVTN
jgi:hypothetical protein